MVESLLSSNSMWLAKIHFLKGLTQTMNYNLAETLVTGMIDLINKENPKENPLYYSTNLLLLTCEAYELSLDLESEYSFLSSHTEKFRE